MRMDVRDAADISSSDYTTPPESSLQPPKLIAVHAIHVEKFAIFSHRLVSVNSLLFGKVATCKTRVPAEFACEFTILLQGGMFLLL